MLYEHRSHHAESIDCVYERARSAFAEIDWCQVALLILGRQAGDGERRWRLKTKRYAASMASTKSFRKDLHGRVKSWTVNND